MNDAATALQAGAHALWLNRNRNSRTPTSPGPDYADELMARVVLESAAPVIRAAALADAHLVPDTLVAEAIHDERERIRPILREKVAELWVRRPWSIMTAAEFDADVDAIVADMLAATRDTP